MTHFPLKLVIAGMVSVIAGLNGSPAVAADSSSSLQAEELVRAFHACATDDDGARRLACYDKAMKRPVKDEKAEQIFGLTPEQVLQKEHLAQASNAMTAQVVAVSRAPRGPLLLTLANGQVWVGQDADEHDVSINVGDTVTVTRAVLGSFLLTSSGSGHRSIRVKRVK